MRTLNVTVVFFFLFAVSNVFAHSDPQSPAGFPNVTRIPGELLTPGLIAPNQGRTAVIAYHEGIIFSIPETPSSNPGSDLLVRSWDISDEAKVHNPVELAIWGTTQNAGHAHSYYKNGVYLSLGSNYDWLPGEPPWSFRLSAGEIIRESNPDMICTGLRSCSFSPWVPTQTYWTYNEVGGLAGLSLDGDFDNPEGEWDHLSQTGVLGFPFLIGNIMYYASDQSRTGVAAYDVSDPANPVLLDVLTDGGPGGYWPQLWGWDGKLLMVFASQTPLNGMRVVDVTDPTDLKFIADVPLPGDEVMYAQFQDEYAFMGSHKVDMRTFESIVYFNPDQSWSNSYGSSDRLSTSQILLPVGNLLITGGAAPDHGMAIWAHQAEPDTRGPSVGFHIPRDGQNNYPTNRLPVSVLIPETLESSTIINGDTFIVQPLGGSPVAGKITYSFDDILTFTPNQAWVADTTYQVLVPGGGIKDAAGNGIEDYSFSFSTGSAVGGNAPPVMGALTVSVDHAQPAQSVQITIGASDPDGDALEYRFDYGDGTDKTPWSSSNQITYAFAEEGHYKITAQARDTSFSLASVSSTFTVIQNITDLSKNSSQLQCDDVGRRVFTVNPDNNTVTAINADTHGIVYEVNVCKDPRSVAQSSTGQLWIACHDSDEIQVRNASDGAFVETISTGYGSAPNNIVISPDNLSVYVSLHNKGQLNKYDSATRNLTGQLDLGPTANALAINGNGTHVYVSRLISPRQHAEIWDVNTTGAMSLAQTFTIRKFGGAENEDGTGAGRGVANYLTSLLVSRDGNSLWFTATKPNTERGLLFHNDLDEDNTVRNVMVQLNINDGSVIRSVDLDNSDSASALAKSPLGDYLLVTLQGNNNVSVFDELNISASSGMGGLLTKIGTGLAPQGVCVDKQTGQTFTKNLTDRTVTTVATNDMFVKGDISIDGTEITTVANELQSESIVRGKQIFYNASDRRMSAEGYLTCASCHLDGGHDGRSWDFTGRAEGQRNTVTLRGRSGVSHGNVHWSSNFDEIQDFEHDIRGPQGGTGFLTDAQFAATNTSLGAPKAGLNPDLDALADYVTSLNKDSLPKSPYRQDNGDLTNSALLGEAVFNAENCSSCHSGASFTDSQLGTSVVLHDIGTIRTTSGSRLGGELTGIDTPTLLGVWATAPYLHDGSAATLADVFVNVGGDVLQAEDGVLGGGAQLDDSSWVFTDDTQKNRADVDLNDAGNSVTFTGVNSFTAGVGAIEIRYSSSYTNSQPMVVIVNGIDYPFSVGETGNNPGWRMTMWDTKRVEGIQFATGDNTVIITKVDNSGVLNLDEITISLPENITAAQGHRRVLDRSSTEQDNLIQYLLQLDSKTGFVDLIFTDGFEN